MAAVDECAREVISIDESNGLVVNENALRDILLHPDVKDLPVAVICVAGEREKMI